MTEVTGVTLTATLIVCLNILTDRNIGRQVRIKHSVFFSLISLSAHYFCHPRPSSWRSPLIWSLVLSTCTQTTLVMRPLWEATLTTAFQCMKSPSSIQTTNQIMRRTPPGSMSPSSQHAGMWLGVCLCIRAVTHQGPASVKGSTQTKYNCSRLPACVICACRNGNKSPYLELAVVCI